MVPSPPSISTGTLIYFVAGMFQRVVAGFSIGSSIGTFFEPTVGVFIG